MTTDLVAPCIDFGSELGFDELLDARCRRVRVCVDVERWIGNSVPLSAIDEHAEFERVDRSRRSNDSRDGCSLSKDR
jgi:hypothetical protein